MAERYSHRFRELLHAAKRKGPEVQSPFLCDRVVEVSYFFAAGFAAFFAGAFAFGADFGAAGAATGAAFNAVR